MQNNKRLNILAMALVSMAACQSGAQGELELSNASSAVTKVEGELVYNNYTFGGLYEIVGQDSASNVCLIADSPLEADLQTLVGMRVVIEGFERPVGDADQCLYQTFGDIRLPCGYCAPKAVEVRTLSPVGKD